VEAVPIVKSLGWVEFDHRHDNGPFFASRFINNGCQNARADAAPLQFRHDIELAQCDICLVHLRLNPSDLAAIHQNDAHLLQLELIGEARVLSGLIPAE
jgi:hypothetical protein